MKLNGVDVGEFDILDLETAEKYEKALEILREETKEDKYKGQKLSNIIRTQCKATFNFLNTLFGEGTDVKVFKDKVNLGQCLDAVNAVIDEVKKQRDTYTKYLNK